jgi:hypothetical protein
VRTVEGELRRYRSRARWAGVPVRADVAGLLTPAAAPLTPQPQPQLQPAGQPEPEATQAPSVPLLPSQPGAVDTDLAAAARERERVGR